LFGCDLSEGAVLAERRLRLGARAFRQFSELTGDNHPIHDDIGYAQARGLRAPIAHGLLLVAVSAIGGTTLSSQLHDSMLAMVGTHARFVSPVFVGDEVLLRFRVGSVVAKDANRCLARFDVDVLDESGRPVAVIEHQFLLRYAPDGCTP
jgi:acyl dehydratase